MVVEETVIEEPVNILEEPEHLSDPPLRSLKTKASSLKVIKVDLPPPQDFLPLGLKNFDLLDAQPGIDFPEEYPTKHNIIRRSDDSIQKEKVYGFYNGCWAIETSEEVIEAVENVSMIVEDSDGKVNQSWCQMAT